MSDLRQHTAELPEAHRTAGRLCCEGRSSPPGSVIAIILVSSKTPRYLKQQTF